jgi:tRNA threonylcarbamoyl adenosine modification protein YeaZ
MRVLAIDTALAACSAAVLDTDYGGGVLASDSLSMTRGHAEALMPLIYHVMQRAQMAFADLDRVAVTTGPGSFTGLRVGISAARGIALAADKPAVGVSTLTAYAAQLLADHVYLQVFGFGGRVLIAPRLAPMGDAVRAASDAQSRIVGSAAQSIADRLPRGAPLPLLVDVRNAPDIVWVARMGAVLPEGQSPPKPQYLRAPDAQPQNAAQLPRR